MIFSLMSAFSQGFYSMKHAVDSVYVNDNSEDGPKAKVGRMANRWGGQFGLNGSFTQAAQNFNSFATGITPNTRISQSGSCAAITPVWREIGPTMDNANASAYGTTGAGQMNRIGMTANQHFYKSYGISCFSKHIRSKVINSGNYEVVRLEPTSTPDLYSPLPSGDFNASGEIYIEGYGKVNDHFFVFETKDVYCTSLIIDGADSLGGTDALTMGINHALVRRNHDEVYPNPAKYRLHVAIPYEAQANGKIILRYALGHVLQSIPADGQEVQELNIESYAPGIYFLSIQSPSYARTFKVLREE